MSNFKVGDVVERVTPGGISGLPLGQQGIVVDVVWGGMAVRIKGFGHWLHQTSTLKHAEQDDPLPPAPESVRYYTVPSKTQYLDILPNEFGEVEIRSILPDFASYNYLTPDAALQLAHDLRRMAMDIKRKERQG